ncbi:MAG: ATP-binding protein [Bacteroidota bacterium]
MMSSWFLLHTHSLMAFIMVATQLGMLLFLLNSSDQIPVRRWMVINYFASTVWYLDQIFRFSLYPGTEGGLIYKLETIFVYTPALAAMLLANFQIYYLFIESKFEKERKWMEKLVIPFALLMIAAIAWNELKNESNLLVFQAISFLWGMLTNIGTLIIAVRKAWAFKGYRSDGWNAHLLFAGVSSSFIFLSVINLIFGLYSPIGYWTFFIFIWIGNLMLIITYLTYSSVFVSFQIKITGYSYVVVVSLITVVALVFYPPLMPLDINNRMLQQSGLMKMFLILSFAILFVVIVLPSLLRKTLTLPLKSLLTAVDKVNAGKLNIVVPELYNDEIGSLTRHFNKMTDTLYQTNSRLVEYTQTLTELYTNQQTIQEQTLNHVSQEIHDNVGQLLSLVKLQLNLAAEKEGDESQLLADARENIGRAMMDLRDMAKGMSSDRIRLLGLFASVNQEAQRIQRTGVCEVSVICQGQPLAMDSQKETILFRVIQECLQNIIKHAQATQVEIAFAYAVSTVKIEVRDNGKGFLISRGNSLSGLGMMNMHHRIELMRGKVTVESEPGFGTKIMIELPLV